MGRSICAYFRLKVIGCFPWKIGLAVRQPFNGWKQGIRGLHWRSEAYSAAHGLGREVFAFDLHGVFFE